MADLCRFAVFSRPVGCGDGADADNRAADLTRRGFSRVRLWTRGVNHAVYRPRLKARRSTCPGQSLLSVGRVAVEKNLEALLGLDLPGWPTVHRGRRASSPPPPSVAIHMRISSAPSYGDALADIYASADVFVFPSRHRYVSGSS